MESQCEILLKNNSVVRLEHHPKEDYGAVSAYTLKRELINKQIFRSNMLKLWIRNSLTTYVKTKLRQYNTSYACNIQYDGSKMLFVIFKMAHPDKNEG